MSAATALAPVPKLALEIRLNQHASEPDLHQLVSFDSGDANTLAEFLSVPSNAAQYPALMLSWLNRWRTSELKEAGPDHLYFEWDYTSLADAPSVFIPVDATHGRDRDPSTRGSRLAALEHLAGTSSGKSDPGIWPGRTGTVSVSHVGAMPSRGGLLRVNYRGVRAGELTGLLEELSWPGDTARVTALFGRLLEMVDKITVAVTFENGRALPGLGLEILFEETPQFEPRWGHLFRLLHELKCCRQDEADCLLALDRRFYPYEIEPMWPASWILATEESGGFSMPCVDRALSHVKVTVSPEGGLSAKAYVSARQQWEDTELPTQLPNVSSRGAQECVDAAIAFLLGKRLQNGWWTEFHTLLGPSDEWTTAFAGGVLAQCPSPEAKGAAVGAAKRLLSRQRADGGWGYNADCPSDADTTAWVLKLLMQVGPQVGQDSEATEKGLDFLRRHVTAGGTVATYQPDAAILFAREEPLAYAKGWQSGHLCVSANAAALLGESWVDSLAEQQHPAGYWQPYWWRTPALATALSSEALLASAKHQTRLLRAVAWANDFQPEAPSVFVESWLIRILLCGTAEDRRMAQRRADTLRSQQRPDGSWSNSADLRIPAADDAAGNSAPDVQYERRGVFTTASALACLLLCAAAKEASCPA